ncbi:MAG TPA: alpha/beta fold hydrolase [Ancylobacter sp.]
MRNATKSLISALALASVSTLAVAQQRPADIVSPITDSALTLQSTPSQARAADRVAYDKPTAENSVMLFVDHQVGLMASVRDFAQASGYKANVVALAQMAKALKIPVLLTTSNAQWQNGDLLPELKETFPDQPIIRRTGIINAYEDHTGTFPAAAEPAVKALGNDFTFPNRIESLPGKLSDFKDLQINTFVTNDGVTLSYWEAGQGKPLIFVPGWSANGAQYINVVYLLSKQYHVYVLDPRNQGLSQHVDFGGRIARFSMDLKQFGDHLGLETADYVGHSMGAAILWSYVDLFGTQGVDKVAFVDEPISIYSHSDWSEQERLEAGGTTTSPERMVACLHCRWAGQ